MEKKPEGSGQRRIVSIHEGMAGRQIKTSESLEGCEWVQAVCGSRVLLGRLRISTCGRRYVDTGGGSRLVDLDLCESVLGVVEAFEAWGPSKPD